MTTALAWCAGPAALAGVPFSPAPAAAPKLPAAAVWLALARRALAHGRHDEALRCFDGALAHEPRHALAHLGRALCHAALGDEPRAAEATRAALEAARGQEELLYTLARACAAQGQPTVGAALLADAVRAMPRLEERAVRDPMFADHPAYLAALGRL
ncbi:MAG TPA: tetratricopeptide repeat protein [Candidatus Thermoplasmatota archaeon]|nr:tetratricopeptide repeat protein [Candidatus Thermoplasmatota archaeon]